MTKRTKINQAEMDKLDEIYQKSIEELSTYWTMAREANEPDLVLDHIWNDYAEEIAAIFNVSEVDELYDLFPDYGPRDFLYESIDGGIN